MIITITLCVLVAQRKTLVLFWALKLSDCESWFRVSNGTRFCHPVGQRDRSPLLSRDNGTSSKSCHGTGWNRILTLCHKKGQDRILTACPILEYPSTTSKLFCPWTWFLTFPSFEISSMMNLIFNLFLNLRFINFKCRLIVGMLEMLYWQRWYSKTGFHLNTVKSRAVACLG